MYCRHLIEFQEDFLVNPSNDVACPNNLHVYMRGESWNFLTDFTLLLKRRIECPAFSCTFLEDPYTPKRQHNADWRVAKRDMYCDTPNEMFDWNDPVWVSLVKDDLLMKVASSPSYSEWEIKIGGRQSDVEENRRAEIEALMKCDRSFVQRHEWTDGTFVVCVKYRPKRT